MKPEVEKYADNKVEEERNLLAKIVSALAEGKDNETIMSELHCTVHQIFLFTWL